MENNNFHDLLRQADCLSKQDLHAAIEMLHAMQYRIEFWPWGAHNLVKLYERASRLDEARRLSAQLIQRDQRFLPGWVLRILLNRQTRQYIDILEEAAIAISQLDRVSASWFKTCYVEILLGSADISPMLTAAPGIHGGCLDATTMTGISILIPVIAKLKLCLATHKHNIKAPLWCLSFLETTDPYQIENGIIHINLSTLAITEFGGWETSVAGSLVRVLDALMERRHYFSEDGVTSWPHLRETHALSAQFWRLLFNEAHRQCEGRIVKKIYKTARIASGDLWVRPGNVEMWAAWNYLHDFSTTPNAARKATEVMLAATQKGEDISADSDWWPRSSAITNITKLSMNAGWYAKPSRAADAFSDWAERYLEALGAGRLLALSLPDLMRLATLHSPLREQTPYDWDDEAFICALDGTQVVFVTAYADEISSQFESGRLHELWRDLGFSSRLSGLTTIQAPMSIWPYNPSDDWASSYSGLYKEAARAVVESHATVFLASCGCYGLPLVHEIHSHFGLTSIHYGHALNLFFGILTNASLHNNLYLSAPTSRNWLRVNLGNRYSALERIDHGRYVFTSPGQPIHAPGLDDAR